MSDYFDRLPDEIVAKIFNRLHLHHLARIELVSQRWKSVQEYVLTRISSLTLYRDEFAFFHPDFFQLMFFEPLSYSPYYDNNSLLFKKDVYLNIKPENNSESRWLVKKLPNITELSMWQPCAVGLDVNYLLKHWTGLEKVNIADYFLEELVAEFSDSDIYSLLNRLASLKHLYIFQTYNIDKFKTISQLETVCIENEHSHPLSNTISKLGPNIRHLYLCNFNCSEQEVTNTRNALQQNDVLANALSKQVTHLTLQTDKSRIHESYSVTVAVLNLIMNHFSSLTHLDIRLHQSLFLHEIVGPLSRLKQLTSLRLSTHSTRMGDDDEYARIYQANTDLLGNGIQSVRKLHISSNQCVPTTPKATFYEKILPLAFPCLDELHFEKSIQMYQCVDCSPSDRHFLKYRLFDGGNLCLCPNILWNTFVEMKLQTVYRNTHYVYRHKKSTFEQFLVRLERFGQSPYRSEMCG